MKKLSFFYHSFSFLFDPIKVITQNLYQSTPEEEMILLVDSIKGKKVNNILFNECLSLAIIKRQDMLCLKLLEVFPNMNINLGYRRSHITQDAPLNLATICLSHSDELILKLIDKTSNINQKANGHPSETEHYPNALFSYLKQTIHSNKNEIKKTDIVQKFLLAGSNVNVEKNMLIKTSVFEVCNCLDLAILGRNPAIIDLMLTTSIATKENIEHAKYMYEFESIGQLLPEKNTHHIITSLTNKLVEVEKRELEKALTQPIKNSHKKMKV
jgi:hypothetical protein